MNGRKYSDAEVIVEVERLRELGGTVDEERSGL